MLGGGLSIEAALGRATVLKERRDAGVAVRLLVQSWEKQRRKDEKLATKAAKESHGVVIATRKHAGQVHERMMRLRQREAEKLRTTLKELENERQTTVIAMVDNAKAAAQHVYDRRFVADALAEKVATSEWGAPDLIISQVSAANSRVNAIDEDDSFNVGWGGGGGEEDGLVS